VNVNVRVNVNEIFFWFKALAVAAKNIFPKEKLLPDCNTESTEEEETLGFKTFLRP
jgi:hypothetical protein